MSNCINTSPATPDLQKSYSAGRVCGIPISRCTYNEVLDDIDLTIRSNRRGSVICVTNTESMYYALRSPDYAQYIQRSRFSLCDGIGVVLAGFFQGKRLSRLTGPALLEQCCARGLASGWRHFFYGGPPGLAERLASQLKVHYTGLIVAGTYSPPFRSIGAIEETSVLDYINGTRPDILWVGLGLPKQEKWIADHVNRLNVPWCVGVGAAFGYLAGTSSWAPVWIRKIGFEWLYRLFHEPRMLPRVARSFIFLGQALGHGLFQVRPKSIE